MSKQFTAETPLSVAYKLNEISGPQYHPQYLVQLQRAVRFFEDSLGRSATLADLNRANVDKFLSHVAGRAGSKTTANYSALILRVWRHLRMVAREAVARPEYVRKTKCAVAEENPLPSDPVEARQFLEGYFNQVYLPRRLLSRSPQTIIKYRLTIRRFGEYLGRRARLDDLTDDTVAGFLYHRRTMGMAENTVDKERDDIVALANYAARKRAIPEFLDLPRVTPASISPQCWRVEQVEKLLEAARQSPGHVGDAPARYFWEALILVFLYTGERTGATLAMRWDWLTPDGWMRVPAHVRKFRKKPMLYRLPPKVMEAIERLREFNESSGNIFAMPWKVNPLDQKPCSFYLYYSKLLKRAGLPDGRKYKPQMIRRTFASFLEAAGGDATRALAHSSRKVTEESYLDETVIERVPSSSFIEKTFG